MIYLSEEETRALVTRELAYEAALSALLEAAGGGVQFPAVVGHGSSPANRFTVKSAAAARAAGVKVGSYWPGNTERGLPRHNSVIQLFDQSAGRIGAVVEAGYANAFRTAAADAVAADVLARPDARPTAVGDVLAGRAAGRSSPEDVTVFDSSGIALQDLHLGVALLRAAGLTPPPAG